MENLHFFFLSCVVSSISFTVTEMKSFLWLRNYFENNSGCRVKKFFHSILICYYCFSHWIAFPLSLYFEINLFEGTLGLLITPFVIVWISVIMTMVVELIFKKLDK